MQTRHDVVLQGLVFTLVATAFTNVYLTQPVLPIIASEFSVDETRASLSISMVTLGIALSNLPFGKLADRAPIRPIILGGGLMIIIGGLVCAVTYNMPLFIAARFVQGLFVPSLTTCLAAYLARSLHVERLNVVMGSYVSATVCGGLGGRLLGGWIHPPLHWRYAFFSASTVLLLAIIAAMRWLPKDEAPSTDGQAGDMGFIQLLLQWQYLRIFLVAFGSFGVFSSVFNYLPFYLSGPPFHAPTEMITVLYLVYLVGVLMGPLAGRVANRIGNGATMALGALVFGLALTSTLVPALIGVILSLAGICAGFFATHASAAGALNSKLTSSRGRANSLYTLFYYVGGTCGITVSGYAYAHGGWPALVAAGVLVLLLPFGIGLVELRVRAQQQSARPTLPARDESMIRYPPDA